MDHVIDYISDYMESDVSDFINQWNTRKYNKISECPSYGAVKAFCEARNTLSKYLYGKAEYWTPRDYIENGGI